MQNLGGIFKGLPCTREAFSSFPIRTPELRPLGSLLVGEVWRSAFPRPPFPPRLHLASHHQTHLSEIEFPFTAPKSSVSCPCILTSAILFCRMLRFLPDLAPAGLQAFSTPLPCSYAILKPLKQEMCHVLCG